MEYVLEYCTILMRSPLQQNEYFAWFVAGCWRSNCFYRLLIIQNGKKNFVDRCTAGDQWVPIIVKRWRIGRDSFLTIDDDVHIKNHTLHDVQPTYHPAYLFVVLNQSAVAGAIQISPWHASRLFSPLTRTSKSKIPKPPWHLNAWDLDIICRASHAPLYYRGRGACKIFKLSPLDLACRSAARIECDTWTPKNENVSYLTSKK